MTEVTCAAVLDRLTIDTRVSSETIIGVLDRAVDGQAACAVPPSSCQVLVRNVLGWSAFGFPPGYGGLQSAFHEQGRGQNRRLRVEYNYGDPTWRCYRCDNLAGPDLSGTLAIDLNGGYNC